MQIAVFGLGKMGSQIARRLHKNGFDVLAWNRSPEPREEVAKAGRKTFGDVSQLVAAMDQSTLSASFETSASPPEGEKNNELRSTRRVFWLMLLQDVEEEFLQSQLMPHLKPGDIVIDGANNHYKVSIKRAEELKTKGVIYYDAGVSGGVWGYENGFALMVGGPKEQWSAVEPVFKALSSGSNYGLLGKNGAGHFVKMVHNGIEYGMMEAIAEGYAIMEASDFNLDLGQVTKIYQEGSVVKSWLIDLTKNIFDNEDVAATSGYIHQLGEGKWTVDAAKELGVDARVIEDSVKVRDESSDPKNQQKFSNKIVALLRKQFGGHGVTKE
jgi:6-phosphogluconate dehydrogenase